MTQGPWVAEDWIIVAVKLSSCLDLQRFVIPIIFWISLPLDFKKFSRLWNYRQLFFFNLKSRPWCNLSCALQDQDTKIDNRDHDDLPYLIFVIFFTWAKFLENEIYTEKTCILRQNTQKMPIFCVITAKYTVNCQFFALLRQNTQ